MRSLCIDGDREEFLSEDKVENQDKGIQNRVANDGWHRDEQDVSHQHVLQLFPARRRFREDQYRGRRSCGVDNTDERFLRNSFLAHARDRKQAGTDKREGERKQSDREIVAGKVGIVAKDHGIRRPQRRNLRESEIHENHFSGNDMNAQVDVRY